MALQLERTREIGTLRATGMSRTQVTRLILTETGIMGAISGLLALPVGFLMALILIFVINLRSFGWTLALHLQPLDLLQAFGVAVSAAMLAGLYPAIRFGRIKPAEALRAE
jgi:putative ABC transport system permease protein